MAKLDAKVTHLTIKHDLLEKEVKELSSGIEFVSSEVENEKEDHRKSNVKSELNTLKQSILYLNSYSRRENLNFFGVKEEKGENTLHKVQMIIQNNLGIENPSIIEFQRIHRLGQRRGNSPRPIIARFLRYTDREKES